MEIFIDNLAVERLQSTEGPLDFDFAIDYRCHSPNFALGKVVEGLPFHLKGKIRLQINGFWVI